MANRLGEIREGGATGKLLGDTVHSDWIRVRTNSLLVNMGG